MGCIFCMIKDGQIPSAKVYENEYVMAFLDLSQANMGHTLVIPKAHADTLLALDDKNYCEVMKAVKKLANVILKATNADGINIINNSYEAAGQTVMHAHVHIIPRFKNDNIRFEFPNNEGKYNLEEVANTIKAQINE